MRTIEKSKRNSKTGKMTIDQQKELLDQIIETNISNQSKIKHIRRFIQKLYKDNKIKLEIISVPIIIYRHSIIIDNKEFSYIGQTFDTKKRWKRAAYEGCEKFYSAIQQYGFGNFKHEKLLLVDNEIEAEYFERWFIKKYNSIENGFNEDNGGSYRKQNKYTPIFNELKSNYDRKKYKPEYFAKVISKKYKLIDGNIVKLYEENYKTIYEKVNKNI